MQSIRHSTAGLRNLRLAVAALLIVSQCACSLWKPSEAPSSSSNRKLPGEEAPEQVIDPNLQRPEVKLRTIRPEDYEAGAYVGLFALDRNHVADIAGVRAAYHKSEDLFVEARYADSFGHGEFRTEKPYSKVSYFDLSVGYNALPGDLYVGKGYVLPIVFYGIAGAGYTEVNHKNFESLGAGAGLKIMPTDWLSMRFEARGVGWSDNGIQRNAELTFGLAAFF